MEYPDATAIGAMTREELEALEAEAETFHSACPYCKKAVATRWTSRGCLPSPDYVLVADGVFHSDCWDRQVAEHPPGSDGAVDFDKL
jgi:hypothetical protein